MSYSFVSVAHHHDNRRNYIFCMSVSHVMLLIVTVINFRCHADAQIFRSSCRKDALFKVKTREGKLTSGILISKQTHGLDKCAKSCIDGSPCMSINYRKTDGFCQLLEKNSSTETAQPSADWNYYEPIYMVRIKLSLFLFF